MAVIGGQLRHRTDAGELRRPPLLPDTSFRAATRTAPGAMSDLHCAEGVAQTRRTGFCLSRATKRSAGRLMNLSRRYSRAAQSGSYDVTPACAWTG